MARGVFLWPSNFHGPCRKIHTSGKGRISSAFRFPKTTIPTRSLSLYARRRMESTALFAKESLSFAPWERLASRNKTDTLFFLRKRFSRDHRLISRSSPRSCRSPVPPGQTPEDQPLRLAKSLPDRRRSPENHCASPGAILSGLLLSFQKDLLFSSLQNFQYRILSSALFYRKEYFLRICPSSFPGSSHLPGSFRLPGALFPQGRKESLPLPEGSICPSSRDFPHPVRQNIPGSPLKILPEPFLAFQCGNGLCSPDHSDIRPMAVSAVGNTRSVPPALTAPLGHAPRQKLSGFSADPRKALPETLCTSGMKYPGFFS